MQSDNLKGISYFAELLHIGPSYLSRVLGNSKMHMSNDLLFDLSNYLGLKDEEVEFLLLLKEIETSKSIQRIKHLREKIQALKNEYSIGKNAEIKKLSDSKISELMYWINPIKMLIHASLDLKKIAQNPEELSSLLYISKNKLNEILKELEVEGLIIWNKARTAIAEVRESDRYLPRGSPLLVAHQNLIFSLTQAQLLKNEASENMVLSVAFTMSEKNITECRAILNNALDEIRKITRQNSPNRLYQVNVQLFPWF